MIPLFNHKNLKKILTIIIVLIGIIALWIIHGIYISYNNLIVTNYNISSEKLTNPCKLVVISDLHDHQFEEKNSELIAKIEEQQPDAILMDGDMLNEDSKDASIVISLIKSLKPTASIYYALGNHELAYMETAAGKDFIEQIEAAGAKVFEKNAQDIQINGNTIRFGGLYDYAFALDGENTVNPKGMDPEIYQFLKQYESTEAFKIMLSHRPDSFVLGEAKDKWKIDLVISGHTHGGQVILPFLGGLWGPDQGWFPDYVEGYHHFKTTNVVITRGLSSEEQLLPRFRNPGEILLLTLQPQE